MGQRHRDIFFKDSSICLSDEKIPDMPHISIIFFLKIIFFINIKKNITKRNDCPKNQRLN